jgi:excisionase family DNA binding protein
MVGKANRIVKRSLRDAEVSADRDNGRSGESKGELLLYSDSARIGNYTLTHTTSKILGVDDLAVLFNCSAEKIKRLARKKELPAFKFGKTWFVRERDLEAYIARRAEPKLDR